MSECWKDPNLIQTWDEKGSWKYKCVKAQLNCHECGIQTCVTSYDNIHEGILIDTDVSFHRDFMDAVFALVNHTDHFRSRIAAMVMSYPEEYMWMSYLK